MALSTNEFKALSNGIVSNIIRIVTDRMRDTIYNAPFDKTFRANVVDSAGGKYTVEIAGKRYTNVHCLEGVGALSIGDVVAVKSPCNNMSDLYIEGKLVN